MSNIAVLPTQSAYDNRQLALIRRTVAVDATDDEFNLFIAYCGALNLDPRRRQIYCFIYSKNDPKKRKMSIVVAIDGLRSIAARSGCYRPDEDEPAYEIDPSAKSPQNPAGLVKASVKLWQHSHGSWHPVTGVAYWGEYAPLKDEWAEDETGTRRPSGKRTLDQTGKWAQMPRLMLAKVAEALALRKAWPDDFSGVYSEEEIERSKELDLLPSEAVTIGATQDRLERIGAKNTILIDWLDNSPIEAVPVGKLADRAIEFVGKHAEEPSVIGVWQSKNRHALREFWAQSPSDGLELKKRLEKAVAAAVREG